LSKKAAGSKTRREPWSRMQALNIALARVESRKHMIGRICCDLLDFAFARMNDS
jgi:hypothetical protein